MALCNARLVKLTENNSYVCKDSMNTCTEVNNAFYKNPAHLLYTKALFTLIIVTLIV